MKRLHQERRTLELCYAEGCISFFMRIWIPIFALMRILLLIKVIHTLQGFIFEPHTSIVSVHGSPWLRCEPQFLSFDANLDQDLAFQS
jgi:hypothetical protein